MSKLVSSVIRLILLGFLAFFVYFHDLFHVTFEYPYYQFMDNPYIRVAKICLLLLLLIEVLRVFYYGVIKNEKAPKWLGNVGTLAVPLVTLLVFLEIGFMFVEQSHEGALSLASHVWFQRHWPPMTGIGYRDAPHTDTTGKKKVLIVGDSFTSGHGLKNVADRYGNVLAGKLGKNYTVYNLGISGSDTRDEFKRFTEFGVRPDVLVLQYFPNDIEKAAAGRGVTLAGLPPYGDLRTPWRQLVQQSYLLNYIYWQIPHGDAAPFMEYTRKVYGDPGVMNDHLSDLGKFVAIRDSLKIPLYVVLFPFSHNLEKTAQYTAPIARFFQQHNVPVLEVGSLVKDVDPNDRIVGRNDFHASAIVNHRVGDALYEMVARGNTQPVNLTKK
ncbi:MAG: SGNH/GDSL hydrolase family protein [Spirosoma sp.]|nr:SGNH/GDSL hydrolase family protein [Spirosoma sp.]